MSVDDLVNLITDTRTKRRISRNELSRLSGVNTDMIKKIELKTKSPEIDILIKILNALDIDLILDIKYRKK